MSTRKAVSIGLVVLLHALIGYAFITGLAMNVLKKANKDLNVFDVKEEPPPPVEKPPPPPPQKQEVQPPPMVTPPPIVQTQTVAPPIIQSVPVAPPPQITPTATVAPPPPPAPTISQAAGAKGDPAQWVTSDDYPPGDLRDEHEGVSVVAWDINTQGRIENCHTTQSSGFPGLDDAACRVLTRRGRYTPAKDTAGNPITSHQSRRVRWQMPKN